MILMQPREDLVDSDPLAFEAFAVAIVSIFFFFFFPMFSLSGNCTFL